MMNFSQLSLNKSLKVIYSLFALLFLALPSQAQINCEFKGKYFTDSGFNREGYNAEIPCLEAGKKFITRKGDALRFNIIPEDYKTISYFLNNPLACEMAEFTHCNMYFVQAFYPLLNSFLLIHLVGNGTGYTFLDGRTSKKTYFESPPIFSPNKQLMLISGHCEVMNLSNYNFMIYQIQKAALKVITKVTDKTQLEPKIGCISSAKWLSNEKIEIVNTDGGEKKEVLFIVKTPKGWVVEK